MLDTIGTFLLNTITYFRFPQGIFLGFEKMPVYQGPNFIIWANLAWLGPNMLSLLLEKADLCVLIAPDWPNSCK